MPTILTPFLAIGGRPIGKQDNLLDYYTRAARVIGARARREAMAKDAAVVVACTIAGIEFGADWQDAGSHCDDGSMARAAHLPRAFASLLVSLLEAAFESAGALLPVMSIRNSLVNAWVAIRAQPLPPPTTSVFAAPELVAEPVDDALRRRCGACGSAQLGAGGLDRALKEGDNTGARPSLTDVVAFGAVVGRLFAGAAVVGNGGTAAPEPDGLVVYPDAPVGAVPGAGGREADGEWPAAAQCLTQPLDRWVLDPCFASLDPLTDPLDAARARRGRR